MRIRRILVLCAALAVAGTLAAGCQSGSDTSPTAASAKTPPSAAALLHTSSASMRGVTSVQFNLTIAGNLPAVPIHSANGSLNAAGQAKGNADLSEFGQLVEVEFVLTGDTFYLKGPTGGYQKLSATDAKSLFDPTAILDPNRGVANVLAHIQNPRSEGTASVNGTTTDKITGKVDGSVVDPIVPGVTGDVTATLWLATDAKALPVKAEFTVPAVVSNSSATVDVTLSNYNQPVSVSAPTG
ncbi:MAG TPA: LppX_LprAFG lipoprotein [Pseudonocardiaceae bacterium]|nr:LppX_LprAFG lipoprotein [Pseudonocardiaceae bacterium]